MTKIVPLLYLGNAEDARDREALRRADITHIINITLDFPNVFQDDPSMTYLRIQVSVTGCRLYFLEWHVRGCAC